MWEKDVYWSDNTETQKMKVSLVALRGKSGEHYHDQTCVLLSLILLDLVQFTWDVFCSGAWIQR